MITQRFQQPDLSTILLMQLVDLETRMLATPDPELADLRMRKVKRILHLLKEAKVEKYDELLIACLSNSIASENHHIASMLIANPDCNLNFQNKEGKTLLMQIAELNYPDLFTQLIKTERCNLDIKDNDGETALFKAVSKNHQKIAEQLMAAGCDVNLFFGEISEMKCPGMSLLNWAFTKDNLYMVHLLLKHGAKIHNANEFFDTLIKYDRRNPALLSCLSILCRQQKELRESKFTGDQSNLLNAERFIQAQQYLDKLTRIKLSVFNEIAEGTNLLKDPLDIIAEYDEPLKRFPHQEVDNFIFEDETPAFRP